MKDVLGDSLKKLKELKNKRTRTVALLLVLSLIVSLDVFWILRQPGLTLAGETDCGILDHVHDEECENAESPCALEEHVHNIQCYSDDTTDVESQIDWQKMFANYPYTGDLNKDLVGIAKTQVGYAESKLNFEVSDNGVRRGYTRYGAWYGSPYSDWSAMFVSFCLNYAGADNKEFPKNIGATSMAEQWKKKNKYALKGQYEPVIGDLVFFKDNTVGIVAEVHKASFYVIAGDVENSVRGRSIPMNDTSIDGWGLVSKNDSKDKNENIDLLDISDGPAVFIFEGEDSKEQVSTYTTRNTKTVTDLIPYLESKGGNYFFTLLDKNNQELPKDDKGNYVVQANTGYKLTISFTSPEGFLPGTYQYQIPNGLLVDGGKGDFILKDNTNVGSWVVTDEGLITLVFNENMNSRTDIAISATLGINFAEQEEPINFDGKISVTIQKTPEEEKQTEITKWGIQGSAEKEGKTDPTKIYWNVNIVGNAGSNLPGSVLTDQIITGEWIGIQHYTQSDMNAGLKFGVSDPNYEWHGWTVYPGDPNLTWTKDGWSYKLPEKINCWCGEVTLGNEGWVYYIDYSSTPDVANTPGTLYYMNKISVDNQYTEGGANFTQGEIHGVVGKTGSFVTDAGSGAFLWELQATIPGRKQDQKAEYNWYMMDYLYLVNDEGYNAGAVKNDANLATVTAYYKGTTINVPRIQDATGNEPFVWDNGWTSTSNGVENGREINILCKCECTAESCRFWNNGCQAYWYQKDDGTYATGNYCLCWTETDNVTFTFVYKTQDLSIIENYGGLGYKLQNVAELYYKPNGGNHGTLVSNTQAGIDVPGLVEKSLTQDFDGYTAHYRVTVNEAKMVLTDGSSLVIHDVMTDTLAYISGSLVITTEDANGNVTTLQQGVDYNITYDGTGNKTDESGKKVHILDIEILRPQPVKYILDYDATLIMPEQVTEGIKYKNSATITLWGEEITDTSVEKVYADINIAAKTYKVEMYKTCALTGEPLPGATFGLYNEHGGLITQDVTNEDGELLFQTNIIKGIILREHVLYYMQEIEAPKDYKLDETKHWFCFCNDMGSSCKTCEEIMADTDAVRIPFEQIGKVNAINHLVNYRLPGTGGPGVYPLILVSIIFILIPLVYGFIRRRK